MCYLPSVINLSSVNQLVLLLGQEVIVETIPFLNGKLLQFGLKYCIYHWIIIMIDIEVQHTPERDLKFKANLVFLRPNFSLPSDILENY